MGLSTLDDLHIVHRDLKPDNILVSSTGHLVIADFGYAMKFLEDEFEGARMFTDLGTLGYLAPEMFDANLKHIGYTSSIDCWGLGMIIFEMFLGHVSALPIKISLGLCTDLMNASHTLTICHHLELARLIKT